MTIPLDVLIYTIVQVVVCIGVGFVLGYFHGKQDAEIKAERQRAAEWDREHGR